MHQAAEPAGTSPDARTIDKYIARWVPKAVKANHITLARLACGPVLFAVGMMGNGNPGWMFIIGLISGFSDLFDGAVARQRGEQSALGAFLDPLGDKVLAIFCGAAMWINGWLAGWEIAALLAVETHAVLLPLYVMARRLSQGIKVWPPPKVRPNRWGKWKTGWVASAMGLMLLGLSLSAGWLIVFARVNLWLGMAMGVVAYAKYVRSCLRGDFL